MKKLICILMALTFICALAACGDGNTPDTPEEETFESKIFDGIDAVFDESLGYYNENPSAFQEGATRYLYYTRNTVKYDSTTDSIAVRVGTYSNGEWTYGEPQTCISVSESGWDSGGVFGADVVKGTFAYNGETYSYLMAYCGTNRSDRTDADIGFAVAKEPTGEWVKVGTEPFIEFNSSEWDSVGLTSYPGAIEPSLISYDEGDKVYLFYEESEVFKSNYAVELDCSNMDSIVRGGRKVIERGGISDLGTSNPLLYGADYVYAEDGDMLYAVREGRTTATANPIVADELQALRSSMDILDTIDQGVSDPDAEPYEWWSEIDDISSSDTADFESEDRILGYMRIFSPTIVSNEYGGMLDYASLEILFTSQTCEGDSRLPAEHEDAYMFSQMIHSMVIEL